jgi:hypothetical protein
MANSAGWTSTDKPSPTEEAGDGIIISSEAGDGIIISSDEAGETAHNNISRGQ